MRTPAKKDKKSHGSWENHYTEFKNKTVINVWHKGISLGDLLISSESTEKAKEKVWIIKHDGNVVSTGDKSVGIKQFLFGTATGKHNRPLNGIKYDYRIDNYNLEGKWVEVEVKPLPIQEWLKEVEGQDLSPLYNNFKDLLVKYTDPVYDVSGLDGLPGGLEEPKGFVTEGRAIGWDELNEIVETLGASKALTPETKDEAPAIEKRLVTRVEVTLSDGTSRIYKNKGLDQLDTIFDLTKESQGDKAFSVTSIVNGEEVKTKSHRTPRKKLTV